GRSAVRRVDEDRGWGSDAVGAAQGPPRRRPGGGVGGDRSRRGGRAGGGGRGDVPVALPADQEPDPPVPLPASVRSRRRRHDQAAAGQHEPHRLGPRLDLQLGNDVPFVPDLLQREVHRVHHVVPDRVDGDVLHHRRLPDGQRPGRLGPGL
ncbi:MAG: hypothetical protein AVDCRST_MAG19-1245, partial [uncultured Thermomicrobiales bacterium]